MYMYFSVDPDQMTSQTDLISKQDTWSADPEVRGAVS